LQLGVGTAMDVQRKTPHASTREQGGGSLVGESSRSPAEVSTHYV
jgi:hypothetical protein